MGHRKRVTYKLPVGRHFCKFVSLVTLVTLVTQWKLKAKLAGPPVATLLAVLAADADYCLNMGKNQPAPTVDALKSAGCVVSPPNPALLCYLLT